MSMSFFKHSVSLCPGRAWLYMALNEQSMESYVRMFLENQDQVNDFYVKSVVNKVHNVFLKEPLKISKVLGN